MMAKKYLMAMVCCATIFSLNAQFIDGFEWGASGVCPDHWSGGPGTTVVCPVTTSVFAHTGDYAGYMGSDPTANDYLLYMGNRVNGEAGIEFYAYLPSNK